MKVKIIYATALAALLTHAAFAAPPQIEAMNNLYHAAKLYIDYCLVGHHGCITVEAICYGQCGNQVTADSMGYGCSGDIRGYIPPGFHYAGWSAKYYETGATISGDATLNFDHSYCHNPR